MTIFYEKFRREQKFFEFKKSLDEKDFLVEV